MINIETTKANHYYFRVLAVLAALAMAVSLLVQLARPAEAAFPGQNGNIFFTSDRDGDSEIRKISSCPICNNKLTDNSADDFSPAVSPDGREIAFVSNRDGNYEIYKMNRDGTGQTRLTNNAAIDANPAFSPDGKQIVFSSTRDGDYDQYGNAAPEIYVMNAADGSNPKNLTNDPGGDYDPSFSPKGDKIAFTSTRDSTGPLPSGEIYVMDANGSNPKNLTNHPAEDTAPDWSPDGTKIAFTSYRDGNYEVYVMTSDKGANQQNVTKHPGPDYYPYWGPRPS